MRLCNALMSSAFVQLSGRLIAHSLDDDGITFHTLFSIFLIMLGNIISLAPPTAPKKAKT